MAKIIAVHNQKGGVGKTTTTTNVGFELARKGYKVLLADLDPQATLTSALGVTDPEETVFSALQGAVDGKETRLPWIRLQENISIIRKSKFPQNPKRSVRFSGKRTKRSVQKRKARNTQKAETKVL